MKITKLNGRFQMYPEYTVMIEYEKKEKAEAYKIIKVLIEMYGDPMEWIQRGGWGFWKKNTDYTHIASKQRIYIKNEADILAIQLKLA